MKIFNQIKKLFNKKNNNLEEQIKEIGSNFVESLKQGLDNAESEYHNKNNYPLYQREYYSFNKDLDNKNSTEELLHFYGIINSTYKHLEEVYQKTDLLEHEKKLLFYDENFLFSFLDSYYKLLRKIGNKLKKNGEIEKAYEIFYKIFAGATQDLENKENLIELLRKNDIKFLKKEFKKRNKKELYDFLVLLEKKLEKIKEERKRKLEKEIINNANKKLEDFLNLMKEYKEKGFKKALTVKDNYVCEICKENEKQGWIFADEPFKSGHQTYPFHKGCRCTVVYQLFKPNDERLKNSPF